MLEERTRRYRVDGVSTSYSDASSLLTQLKRDRDHLWLNEVSSVPLQQCLRHQGRAMTNFFEKRASYPKFKKKSRGTISAEYTRSAFKWNDRTLKLAKMAEPLRVCWSRETPKDANPSTVTVSMDASGRFFVSMLFECAIEHHEPLDNAVGIDLGVSTWAALSDGSKINLPSGIAERQKRVVKAQRELSRKQKGSTRSHRARLKLAKANARVADSRKDFLHKVSTRIVRENQTIILEDLAVQNLSRSATGSVNRPGRRVSQKSGLNRAIMDSAWGEFRELIEYKAHWYGRDLVVADRFFPSSKVCSECGHLSDKMPLSVREWECPDCQHRHDRDVNAAKNLVAFALGLREKSNARGGPARPR